MLALALALSLTLALASLGPPRLGTDARLRDPLQIPVQGHPVSSDHLCKNNHDKSAKTLNKKPLIKVDKHTYHLLQ